MSTSRTAITIIAAGLGALPLIACGSAHPGPSTAPSSVQAIASGTFATTDAVRISPLEHGEDMTVTAIIAGTSCPTLQFKIDSSTIKTDASTRYEGGTCANIVVGARLEVTGTKTGTNIVASRIEFKGQEPAQEHEEEGDGVVSLVTGTSCPTLSFKMEEFTVSTTAATTYVGGACANIVPGAQLHVRGRITAEHMAVASRITFRN